MRYYLYLLLLVFFLTPYISKTQNYRKEFYKRLDISSASAQVYSDSLTLSKVPQKRAFGLSAKAYLLIKIKKHRQIDSLFRLSFNELERLSNNSQLKKEEELYVLNFYCLYLLTNHRTQEANANIQEGLNIAEDLDNIEMQVKFQNLHARCYNLIGEREEGLEITKRIAIKLKSAEHRFDDSFFKTNLSYTYLNGINRSLSLYILDSTKYRTYVDTSKAYLKKANNFINSYNVNLNSESQIQLITLTGAIHFYERKYDSAIFYYKKGLDKAKAHNLKKREYQAKYKIAESYFLKGNYEKAKEYFDKLSAKELNQYKLQINKIRINYYYANIYNQLGRIDESLKYSEIFNNQISDYHKEVSDERINILVANELRSKKRIIADLDKMNEKEKRMDSYIKYSVIVIILLLALAFAYIKRRKKELDNKIDNLIAHISTLEKEELNNNPITIEEEKAKIILTKLKKIEKQELFKSQSYSLNKVSKKIGSNSTYVSQAVNAYWNKSFTEYTNELRINYILLKLKHEEIYQKFKLEAIAESVGYKSLRSFNKHFKTQTGLMPKQYIDLLESKKANNSSNYKNLKI